MWHRDEPGSLVGYDDHKCKFCGVMKSAVIVYPTGPDISRDQELDLCVTACKSCYDTAIDDLSFKANSKFKPISRRLVRAAGIENLTIDGVNVIKMTIPEDHYHIQWPQGERIVQAAMFESNKGGFVEIYPYIFSENKVLDIEKNVYSRGSGFDECEEDMYFVCCESSFHEKNTMTFYANKGELITPVPFAGPGDKNSLYKAALNLPKIDSRGNKIVRRRQEVINSVTGASGITMDECGVSDPYNQWLKSDKKKDPILDWRGRL